MVDSLIYIFIRANPEGVEFEYPWVKPMVKQYCLWAQLRRG